jgi:glycosyltransferase involved in cell wall biosynthesis
MTYLSISSAFFVLQFSIRGLDTINPKCLRKRKAIIKDIFIPFLNGGRNLMHAEKIAIIHDWFDVLGGSESVVEQIIHLYPQADLFGLVDFLPQEDRGIIRNKSVRTSFIQNLPFARKHFRNYLALMPLAVEQFDLSPYSLVLSSSHAFAKGFIPTPGQLHISYVHTPVRYAWDLQSVYLKNSHLEHGLKSCLARSILHYIRNWDSRSANGVDVLIANSHFTAQRIWKYYRREAQIIYPPVDTDAFEFREAKEDYFLSVSRLVHYKQVQTIINAFRLLPQQHLIVVGDGPLYQELNRNKPANVEMVGRQDQAGVVNYMQRARALVYAAKEDFGIVPVEAQACGTPVIAYGAGGALETVNGLDTPHPNGLFFTEQTPESIAEAVKVFLKQGNIISPGDCQANAAKFSIARFRDEYQAVVDAELGKR